MPYYIVARKATVAFTVKADTEQDALDRAGYMAYEIGQDDVHFQGGQAYVQLTADPPTVEPDTYLNNQEREDEDEG